MKVVFISISNNPGLSVPPTEPYLLSAVSRRNKHHSRIIHLEGPTLPKEGPLDNMIKKADVFCFISDSLQWPHYLKTVKQLGDINPRAEIIAGGLHPTLYPEPILEKTSVDYVIRGEVETTLTELLSHLKNNREAKAGIPGVSYLSDGRAIHCRDRKPMTDRVLEQVPFPTLEELPAGRYEGLSLETSRGMPFCRPLFPCLHPKQWRFLSPAGVYERIYRAREHFIDRTSKQFIYLKDPYFTAKFKRIVDLDQLCKKKNETFQLDYHAFCSDVLNDTLLKYVRRFTRRIIFTPASGSARMLGGVAKGLTPGVIRDCARMVNDLEFNNRTLFRFYLGLPGETVKDAQKPLTWHRSLLTDSMCRCRSGGGKFYRERPSGASFNPSRQTSPTL